MINILPDHLEIVRRIIAQHVPDAEVRAFGSRVTHATKKYSDLDLAIVADGRLALRTLAEMKLDFEESDLPFRVEVIDWHAISPEFRRVIENCYEVIPLK